MERVTATYTEYIIPIVMLEARANQSITLRQLGEAPSFAVIDILDITAQVGLVKSPKLANTYSVISPYYSFNRNMSTNGVPSIYQINTYICMLSFSLSLINRLYA
ncbi:hypothetical protein BDB01DRAFT_840372 [Pilobolus umbonatus]|nr:hypothetical protein BDB01DRAFT_840372 [Pilobolus umbonatus]